MGTLENSKFKKVVKKKTEQIDDLELQPDITGSKRKAAKPKKGGK